MPFTSAREIRVFLADDHAVLREGLKAILQQERLTVVGEASDGRAAVTMCGTLQPDVAVLDIAMPLLNGVDAAREILKCCPATHVIVLTMYAEDSYVLASLRAGVSGYLLKSNAASTLVYAIKSVMKGQTHLCPEVSRTVVQAYLASAEAVPDPLSAREREVLQLIAEGKNVKEIGALLGISGRTAETHRTRIMAKLEIHDLAGLVTYAIRRGMIRLEQDLPFQQVKALDRGGLLPYRGDLAS
jgi:DNA-binding NarL/FixJ family response regulator